MFELSVALKYLAPKRKQLSASIISSISILVIALVVWLIVVFFSVTDGLIHSWVHKLVALTAPVRVTPTEEYYKSYYYQVDSISANSDYSHKTIGEKFNADATDPYDPDFDEEVPTTWLPPDLDENGQLKDLVKIVYESLGDAKGSDYEMAIATLKLNLLRETEEIHLNQGTYVGSFDEDNPALIDAVEEISAIEIMQQPTQTPVEPVLLPRHFKESGVLVDDQGSLVYYTPTASSMQEQSLPVYVAGFYDPGIIPIGGKYVIASKETASTLRAAIPHEENGNGINVRMSDLSRADEVKKRIENHLAKNGIEKYWKVETFSEYEFTKDLIQQLNSEKNLFTILACIIILVACSNIISMLIILVNDKKVEIGIMRALGATTKNIATIFGLCGVVMGVLGSVIGTAAAIITLHNLDALIHGISYLQGHEMFNPLFYGETLPNTISFSALFFVIATTTTLSLVAGMITAMKACLIRPAAILRAE